jgi:hypothetical protein
MQVIWQTNFWKYEQKVEENKNFFWKKYLVNIK